VSALYIFWFSLRRTTRLSKRIPKSNLCIHSEIFLTMWLWLSKIIWYCSILITFQPLLFISRIVTSYFNQSSIYGQVWTEMAGLNMLSFLGMWSRKEDARYQINYTVDCRSKMPSISQWGWYYGIRNFPPLPKNWRFHYQMRLIWIFAISLSKPLIDFLT